MGEAIQGVAVELEERATRFVVEGRLPGASVGVVHDGQLAWWSGVGFADVAQRRRPEPSTPYMVASITKTLTSTAVMRLAAHGDLDLEQPITAYLPEMRDADTSFGPIEVVTLRRMLSHESGLDGEPPGTEWGATFVRDHLAADALARAGEIGTRVLPHSQSKYSNLAFQLLGEVVARVSGVPYAKYVADEILAPLGMTSSAFAPLPASLAATRATGYAARGFSDQLEPAGEPPPLGAEGGLWSTAEDMARWLAFQLAAHATPAGDSPVLAATTLRVMHQPRFLEDPAWTTACGITWYGVRRDDAVWIQHSGGIYSFTTCICFDPTSEVGAIVLVNGLSDAAGLAMDLGTIARRAVAPKRSIDVKIPEPTPAGFRSLLGYYLDLMTDQIYRVEWRDGALVVLVPDADWKATLLPSQDADRFVIAPGQRASGELATFRRRDDSTVESMLFATVPLVRLVAAS